MLVFRERYLFLVALGKLASLQQVPNIPSTLHLGDLIKKCACETKSAVPDLGGGEPQSG
jgi:hypothetical protein